MMDKLQLQKVFSSYISIFNKPYYDENYKWLIVQGFKAKMDEALQSNTEEFPEKLNVVSKFGSNLLNNYIAPFSGLVYFARKEPETVRKMFLDLYENDYGDLSVRKEHMLSFLWKSHALRDKYSPDSFLYEDNMRSVSTYIFLYDPDHNYIFIPTGARDLADCIEFYDEWGSGENLKLEVYYRMCDQLAEAVSTDELLMATDNSRYSAENGEQYYNDTNHHLLVCDFFYLTTKYHLLDQISYSKPKLKERENYLEKKETALELSRTIEKAKQSILLAENGKEYIRKACTPGVAVSHCIWGKGRIESVKSDTVKIIFDSGIEKAINPYMLAARGDFVVQKDGFLDELEEYKESIINESLIESTIIDAERKLGPIIEFLD